MEFHHTHTITITHASGKVETISVDSAGQDLDKVPPGGTVPLYTREETLMELPADWVFSAEDGLKFFGQAEGPYRDAKYAVAPS